MSSAIYIRQKDKVIDIETMGLGHIGKSIQAISLKPDHGGLRMPFGKDVFQFACIYMLEVSENLLSKNHIPAEKLRFFIPHQANLRISQFIQKKLGLSDDKVFNNIQKYGNTTAASIPIALSEAWEQGKIKDGDLVCLAAFGSGFTWGSALIKW